MEYKPFEHSESRNELFAALAKAQGEFPIALKDSNNPFFKSKYSDLLEVVSAARPHLSKYGLSVTQDPITHFIDGKEMDFLKTTLSHSSGQYSSSCIKLRPAKNDTQTLGAAITYQQRYSFKSILGIVSGDEDDDGETAMGRGQKPQEVKPQQNVVRVELITKEQEQELQEDLEGFSEIAQSIFDKLYIESLGEIPKSKYNSVRRYISDTKRELENVVK